MSASPLLNLLTVLDSSQPLSFGQLRLNGDGVLELRAAPPLQQAQFVWHRVPVRVNLYQEADKPHTTCDVVADLGPLPFSAQNPAQRNALIALMRGFRAPPECKLMLGTRQSVWAFQQTYITLPLAPASVLAEVVVFLHRMGAIMEIVRDVQDAYGPTHGGQRRL